jgi:hypothetical protein
VLRLARKPNIQVRPHAPTTSTTTRAVCHGRSRWATGISTADRPMNAQITGVAGPA